MVCLPLHSRSWLAQEKHLLRAKQEEDQVLAFSLVRQTALEFCANSHIQCHTLNCTRGRQIEQQKLGEIVTLADSEKGKNK